MTQPSFDNPSFNPSWLMITGGDIVLPDAEVVSHGTVLVHNGIIQEVLPTASAAKLLEQEEISVIDATDHWVTPGLIDQHLHGGFGVDFNQASIEDIKVLLKQLPQLGITAVLPTLITAPKLEMISGLTILEEVIQLAEPTEARVLGIHLEGPFLNEAFRGAHPAADLLPMTQANVDDLLSPNLKRITIAPELDPDGLMIAYFLAQGIQCAIGHSGADYQTAMGAFQSGATCVTHLFNAMRRFNHREPGIVTASLLRDDIFVELIADGHHISPPNIQLAVRLKPHDKSILISDCNLLTGLPEGSTGRFGNQQVTVQSDTVVNQEGHLAGSTRFVSDCVRNMVNWGVMTFPHAVQLATYNPALHLEELPLIGQLMPGAVADIVLWRKSDLAISNVFLSGSSVV